VEGRPHRPESHVVGRGTESAARCLKEFDRDAFWKYDLMRPSTRSKSTIFSTRTSRLPGLEVQQSAENRELRTCTVDELSLRIGRAS
jgi:hypothetical protein